MPARCAPKRSSRRDLLPLITTITTLYLHRLGLPSLAVRTVLLSTSSSFLPNRLPFALIRANNRVSCPPETRWKARMSQMYLAQYLFGCNVAKAYDIDVRRVGVGTSFACRTSREERARRRTSGRARRRGCGGVRGEIVRLEGLGGRRRVLVVSTIRTRRVRRFFRF